MLGILAAMMVVIVVTGITHALHPPSNVEPTDPVTLHLQGEFAKAISGRRSN
jgi:cytochrome c oxidase subunit II